MRHDDRMKESEGKPVVQGQETEASGKTETREEAEMSREKGQDAEEKEAAPEAPQEDAAFDRQLEEMMNGTGGKKAGKKKRGKKKFLLAAAALAVLGIGAVKAFGQRTGFRHRQRGCGIQSPCGGSGYSREGGR